MFLRFLRVFISAATFIASGCAGTSVRGTLPMPARTPPAIAQEVLAPVSVSVAIPPLRGSRAEGRSPKFVSPGTQSISIDAGVGLQNFNLVAGAPGCSGPAAPIITEYPIALAAQPRGITTGPDGKIWWNEDNGLAIGRMLPSGTGYTSTATGRLSNAILAGPDGRLWIAYLYGAFDVGVYNNTGALYINYAIPTTQALYLALGSDGAVWYSEWAAGGGTRIGRIPVGGTPVTTYLPSAPASYITNGPDGALWFTESSTGTIGRSTTAGVITEFPVLNAAAQLAGIAAGADGALWFAESGTARIGRITTSGVFSDFPIPGGIAPFGMKAGPDGAMWFTSYAASAIGRITTSGVVSLYMTPTPGSFPTEITPGPDGAMWFTEQVTPNSQIGRITVPGGVTCSIAMSVPAGYDTFTIKTYDRIGGASGGGNVLSAAKTSAQMNSGTPNSLNLSLNGVVNNVRVTAATTVITKGSGQTIPLFVQALTQSSRL